MRKHELENCQQWLLDADTENEDVVYDSLNRVIWLSGDFLGDKLTHNPISIYGLTWPILITGKQMQIGCQRYTHEEWTSFSDSEINSMEGRAEDFWRVNKQFLLSICEHEALLTKIALEKDAK